MSPARKTALALTLLSPLVCGCGDVLAFDLTTEVDEFTIPGDPHLNHGQAPLDAATIPPVEIQFAALKAGSINLASLRFYVTPSALATKHDKDDLEFLQTVSVYALPLSPTSQLPEIEVAHWEGPAEAECQSIDLAVDAEVDLQAFVEEGFLLDIRTGGTVPYDDVSVVGEAVFRVNPL